MPVHSIPPFLREMTLPHKVTQHIHITSDGTSDCRPDSKTHYNSGSESYNTNWPTCSVTAAIPSYLPGLTTRTGRRVQSLPFVPPYLDIQHELADNTNWPTCSVTASIRSYLPGLTTRTGRRVQSLPPFVPIYLDLQHVLADVFSHCRHSFLSTWTYNTNWPTCSVTAAIRSSLPGLTTRTGRRVQSLPPFVPIYLDLQHELADVFSHCRHSFLSTWTYNTYWPPCSVTAAIRSSLPGLTTRTGQLCSVTAAIRSSLPGHTTQTGRCVQSLPPFVPPYLDLQHELADMFSHCRGRNSLKKTLAHAAS